jgi:hypothetical protein
MQGPLGTATSVATPAVKSPDGLKSTCTATANCSGGGTVYCAGTGTCTAVDQNCPNQQGYVNCGTSWALCPVACEQDCRPFDHGGCIYSWDPDTACCVAFNDDYICPYACF